MLIKFTKHGSGSGVGAAGYLTQELDWKGEERADVRVLRGDPDQVAALADSLDFKNKYTSAVIAWSPEDRPTDEQIGQTLDEFERFAWAGMEPDRYAWCAVQHRDDQGGVHVHILTARCELATGKSLNIAPPGWEKQYAPLQEHLNEKHGWTNPDEPDRRRTLQSNHHSFLDAALQRNARHRRRP